MKRKISSNAVKVIAIGLSIALGVGTSLSGTTGNMEVVRADEQNITGTYKDMTGEIEITLKFAPDISLQGIETSRIMSIYGEDIGKLMKFRENFVITTNTSTNSNPQIKTLDATKFAKDNTIKILFEFTGATHNEVNIKYTQNSRDKMKIGTKGFTVKNLKRIKELAKSPLNNTENEIRYLPTDNKITIKFPSSLDLGGNITETEEAHKKSGFILRKDDLSEVNAIKKYKYIKDSKILEITLKEGVVQDGKYMLSFDENIAPDSPFLKTDGELKKKPSGTTDKFKIDSVAPKIVSAKSIKDDNNKNKKIEIDFGEELDKNISLEDLKTDFKVNTGENKNIDIDSAKIDGQKVILTLQDELADSTIYKIKYTGSTKNIKDTVGNAAKTDGIVEFTTNFNNLIKATLKDRKLTLEATNNTTLAGDEKTNFSVKIDNNKSKIIPAKKISSTNSELAYEIETESLGLTENSNIFISYTDNNIKIKPSDKQENSLILHNIYTTNGIDVKSPEIDSKPEVLILEKENGTSYNPISIDFKESLYYDGKEIKGDVKEYFDVTAENGNKLNIESAVYNNGKIDFKFNKPNDIKSTIYTLKSRDENKLTDKNKNIIRGYKNIIVDTEVAMPTITYIKDKLIPNSGEIVLSYSETLYQKVGKEQLLDSYVKNMFEIKNGEGEATISPKKEYVDSNTIGGNTTIKIPVTNVKEGDITLKFKKGENSQEAADAQKGGKPLYDKTGNKTDVDILEYKVSLKDDNVATIIKMDEGKKTFIYKYEYDNINADELSLPIISNKPIKVSDEANPKDIFEVLNGDTKVDNAIEKVTTEANRINIDFNMGILNDDTKYTVRYKSGITDLSGNDVATKDFSTDFRLNRTGVVVDKIGRVFEVRNDKNITAVNNIDDTVAYRDYTKFKPTVDTLGDGIGKIDGIKDTDITYLNTSKNTDNKVVSLGMDKSMLVALANKNTKTPPIIKKINDNAFKGNTNITKIDLPTVTEVGKNAFADANKLMSVELPKVTIIKDNAFKDTIVLEKVDIGTKAEQKVEFAQSIFRGAGRDTDKTLKVSTNKDSADTLKIAIGENKKITGNILGVDGASEQIQEGDKNWKPVSSNPTIPPTKPDNNTINSSGSNGGGYGSNYYKPSKYEKNGKDTIIKSDIPKESIEDKDTRYESTNKVLSINAITLPAIAGESKVFGDVAHTHWANSYIDKLSKAGIINGMQDGSFNPKGNTKRADVTIMISKLLGLESLSLDSFNDVNPNAYYAKAVAAVKEYGIINGSNGNFNPEGLITRQDTMVIIGQILKGLELNVNTDMSALDQFSDKGSISGYANEYVAILVNSGIIEGSNGKINPKQNITRAEMATIISKLYDIIATGIEKA